MKKIILFYISFLISTVSFADSSSCTGTEVSDEDSKEVCTSGTERVLYEENGNRISRCLTPEEKATKTVINE